MKRFTILHVTLWLLCCCTWADEEPGWYNETPDNPVVYTNLADVDIGDLLTNRESMDGVPEAAYLAGRIADLAAGLQHDPKRIYEFVRNEIVYEPYYGWLKGAERTLIDRAGNDLDQADLLVALLKASGFDSSDVKYIHGSMTVPFENQTWPGYDLNGWLGAENINIAAQCLLNGGIPYIQGTNSIEVTRFWVQLTTGGQTYNLDPSLKPMVREECGIDIESMMSYNRTALLTGAGGVISTTEVQNVNETAVESFLTDCATTLRENLQLNYPNSSLDNLLGYEMIVKETVNEFPGIRVSSWQLNDSPLDSPEYDGLIHWIQIGYTDYYEELYRIPTAWIGSRSMSIETLSYWYVQKIYLDDEQVFSGITTLYYYSGLVIEIDHPYAADNGDYLDQIVSYPLATYTYFSILFKFGNSTETELLKQRQNKLSETLIDGSDREKIRHGLNMISESWMTESSMTDSLISRLTGSRLFRQHRIGAVIQDSTGYYIDIRGQKSTINGSGYTSLLEQTFFQSALEHGVLEQLQPPDAEAISTVKVIKLSNEGGDRTFRMDASNASYVKSQLDNYSSSQKTAFKNLAEAGAVLLLPEDGNLSYNSWNGMGYAVYVYNAGGDISLVQMAVDLEMGGRETVRTEVSLSDLEQETDVFQKNPIEQHSPTAADPVDMVTGAYLFNHDDLQMNPASKLTLSRCYSTKSNRQKTSIGYGWRHGLDFFAQKHSEYRYGLGERTIEDTVPSLVAVTVLHDLLQDESTAQENVVACLTADWVMDQLTDNAVSIHTGHDVATFIKQPDGSYTPPPGITTSLILTNGVYVLQERNANTYTFNTNNLIEEISDPNGNTLTFTYNAQTNLQTVVSSFGPALTFSYTGDLLTSVSDNSSPVRTVQYQYDGDDNLTNFTDAAGNDWPAGYDDQHRITWLKDPEGITTIQNSYNSIGQVTNQISASGQSYKLYFTGSRNIEEDPYGNQTIYYIDDLGRTWSIEDALTNFTVAYYDGQNHITNSITEAGVTNVLVYDINHNLLEKREAVGTSEERISYYSYDTTNHLICVSNQVNAAEWQVSGFEYDSEHHLTGITDALGNETVFTYYSNGLLETETKDGGRTTEYTYDAYGNVDTVTSTDAGTNDFLYNIRGNLIQQTDGRGQATDYTYDANGNLLTVSTVLSNETILTTNSYYANNLLHTSTDARDQTTQYTWTPAYKQETIVYPNGGVVSNTYDLADRLIAVKDAQGNISSNALDTVGRITASYSPFITRHFDYDAVGNVTNSTVDPSGLDLWTTTEYDVLNRPVSAQSALSTVQNQYDYLGRATNYIDAASKHWGSEYDLLGRETKITRPSGAEEATGYNALGYRTSFTNAENHVMEFGMDAQGRVTAITNAIGKVTLYQYDVNGNITNRIDAMDESTAYQYDELNRLIRVDSSNSWAEFSYDANGNMTESSNQNSAVSFSYDEMNQLTNSSFQISSSEFQVFSAYDLNGNRTNILYPGGLSVSCSFDAEDRLTGVTAEYTNLTASFSFAYDGAGRMTNIAYPNSVNSAFEYDAESRVVGYSHAGNSNFVSRTISRDARGYKTSENIVTGLEPSFPEGEQRMVHNSADQLTRITQRDTWLGGELNQWYYRNYTYNNNGCTIEESVIRPLWNTNSTIDEYRNDYTWDNDNRLTGTEKTVLIPHDEIDGMTGEIFDRTYTDGPSTSAEYIYDASGVRVGRVTSPSVTNYFILDYRAPLKMPLAETDADGHITRYYIWSSHGLLAHLDISPSTGAITAIRYYHANEQASTLALTDENGDVTDQFAYTPYGGVTHTGSTETPYQWIGGLAVRSEGNGLYYMLNRTYSANMRRFISTDPSGIDGDVNLYAYAGLNPTYYVDPYGLHVSESGGNWFTETLSSVGNWMDQNYANSLQSERDYLQKTTDFYNSMAYRQYSTTWGHAVATGIADVNEAIGDKLAVGTMLWSGYKIATAPPSVPANSRIYRQGTFADESVGWGGNYVKGKQWATENPLTTPNYAKKYGLPSENSIPDWVVGGRTPPKSSTRWAPPSHNNPVNTGGRLEVLPPTPNSVQLDWFHMLDD